MDYIDTMEFVDGGCVSDSNRWSLFMRQTNVAMATANPGLGLGPSTGSFIQILSATSTSITLSILPQYTHTNEKLLQVQLQLQLVTHPLTYCHQSLKLLLIPSHIYLSRSWSSVRSLNVILIVEFTSATPSILRSYEEATPQHQSAKASLSSFVYAFLCHPTLVNLQSLPHEFALSTVALLLYCVVISVINYNISRPNMPCPVPSFIGKD